MIRSIAVVVAMGSLVATGALYGAPTQWQNLVALWGAEPPRGREGKTVASEHWPICTTMNAMGSEAEWAELDPDFATGKKALATENWTGAIAALKLASLRDPRNADIQNYIGYAYRRLRQLGPAMGHYQQALTLNPRHRSAHEHLGELYLTLGEPTRAEHQLTVLEEICLI